MPLWNSHPSRDSRGHCSNTLWARTAEQGKGTVAFIDIVDNGDVNDYFECMKMMQDAEVTIYARVSAMYGFAFGLENRIQKLHEEYQDVLSGFYIDDTPPNLADSKIMKTIKVIKQLREEKYKVAISAHDSEWPMKLVSTRLPNQQVDLLILFDSTHSKWSSNCGIYGSGPFCRTEFKKKGFFDVLQDRLATGRVSRSAFGVILNEVSADQVVSTFEQAARVGIGYIHVTDRPVGKSDGPTYWDYILLNLNQNEKCGCWDLNECKVTNDCHKDAHCINNEGSYECLCKKSFEGDGTNSGTGCQGKGSIITS